MMLPELVILAVLAVIPILALLIVPELTTLASALVAIPASLPLMLAPALLVTLAAPVLAKMPKREVPVMLPELVTLAEPSLA